jgi:hypothetical protein
MTDHRARLIELLGHTSSDYLDEHYEPNLPLNEIADQILSGYATDLAVASSVGQAPATDQTAEIERLRTQNERMRHELEVMYGGAFDNPDAQTVDRAAVLRAAADDIAVAFGDPTAKHIGAIASSWLRRRARETEAGQPELRRMAGETQPAETCPTPETHNWGCGCLSDEHPAALGTLPAWLHQRFDPRGPDWDQLDEDDRSYWEHQARAVRRAFARGGFKQPAVGTRQDGSAS